MSDEGTRWMYSKSFTLSACFWEIYERPEEAHEYEQVWVNLDEMLRSVLIQFYV